MGVINVKNPVVWHTMQLMSAEEDVDLNVMPAWSRYVLIVVGISTLLLLLCYNIATPWHVMNNRKNKKKNEEMWKLYQQSLPPPKSVKSTAASVQADKKDDVVVPAVEPPKPKEEAMKPKKPEKPKATDLTEQPEVSVKAEQSEKDQKAENPEKKEKSTEPQSSEFGGVDVAEGLKLHQRPLTKAQEEEMLDKQKTPDTPGEFYKQAKEQYKNLPSTLKPHLTPTRLLRHYVEKTDAPGGGKATKANNQSEMSGMSEVGEGSKDKKEGAEKLKDTPKPKDKPKEEGKAKKDVTDEEGTSRDNTE